MAKYIVLFAMTDPDKGARGITAFLIDTDARRASTAARPSPSSASARRPPARSSSTDYVADADDVLGEEGQGFKIAMGVLDAGRIGIASQAIGIARAAYEATLEYVQRAQGLRPADRRVPDDAGQDRRHEVQARRVAAADAARGVAEGRRGRSRFTTEAAVAKLTASEAAMWIAHQAVQIHGGMGYSKEMPLERYFRDAKITEIYEGTSEIQRLVIARHETGLR